MSRSNTGMSALIEILNLCAEALTSLELGQEEIRPENDQRKATKASAIRQPRSNPRLALIPGGLSRGNRRGSSR